MAGILLSNLIEILMAAGLLIAGTFGWWQKRRADQESARADHEKHRADTQSIIRGHENAARAKTDDDLADSLTRRD